MSGLEVFICVVIAACLVCLAAAIDRSKELKLREYNSSVLIKSKYVTIERKIVSYYGLCGIKIDRSDFLVMQCVRYRGEDHISIFDIPEGFKAIDGSEVVYG